MGGISWPQLSGTSGPQSPFSGAPERDQHSWGHTSHAHTEAHHRKALRDCRGTADQSPLISQRGKELFKVTQQCRGRIGTRTRSPDIQGRSSSYTRPPTPQLNMEQEAEMRSPSLPRIGKYQIKSMSDIQVQKHSWLCCLIYILALLATKAFKRPAGVRVSPYICFW